MAATLAAYMGGCQWVLDIRDISPTVDGGDCDQWAPLHFSPCTAAKPISELILAIPGRYAYDTNTGQLIDPDGQAVEHSGESVAQDRGDLWLIAVHKLTIAANTELRAEGNRPLLIASWSTVSVDGTIDVSSVAGRPGAGANRDCEGTAAGPGSSGQNKAGGGGGGGGFQGNGGAGAVGDLDQGDGGAGGGKIGHSIVIRGGCPGARGASGGALGSKGGSGGDGGGAIHVTARERIEVRGRVLAGGAGGGGALMGLPVSGGGGGGSGGYIGFDAPEVTIYDGAVLAANGGGGGEGSDYDQAGNPGSDGSASIESAAGGSGGSNYGADGGAGGSRDTPDGGTPVAQQGGGGGGGGGGVGFILLYSGKFLALNATISPRAIEVD
ncbi:MAG: hypothetical protein MJE77_27980 [Proteobacteria bacterium]|nr:hypothetical protein [Pseudomonadota bacterium]